jgi:hypothetical protein
MAWLEPPERPARTTAGDRGGEKGAGEKGAGEKGGEEGGVGGADLAHGGSTGAPAGMGWVDEAARSGSEGAAASEAMAAGLAHLLAMELPAVAAEIDMEALATAQVSTR